MEFAVEAQNLLSVSLEGAVGDPMDKGTMLLKITDLSVRVAGKDILKGVQSRGGRRGSTPSWDPTGRGRAPSPRCSRAAPTSEVTGGSVTFEGQDLLPLPAEERARAGLFLGFQYPSKYRA